MTRILVSLLYGFLLICCSASFSYGQQDIELTGTVVDDLSNAPIQNLMVVSKRTQQGTFSGFDGKFKLQTGVGDSLLIASTGYTTIKIAVADSVSRGIYHFRIRLKRLQVVLKEVEIFTKRDLEAIERDIQTLGYDEGDYLMDGVDAISSPITALYVAFSRRERSKRMVAELRNEDKRRALLKELFRKYVDYEIIDLSNDEFDRFIDFCRISDEFLKNSTQYDFIMYIKSRFEIYRMLEQ
jgi:hypothetical protein